MDNNEKNGSYQYEDEISLRELIETLLKEKFLIIGVMIAVILLAGIYTFGVLKPSYESRATILVNFNETVNTIFGDYEVPLTAIDEYLEMLRNSFVLQRTLDDYGDSALTRKTILDNMNTELINGANTFRLTMSAGTPEDAHELTTIYVDNYMSHLKIFVREMAVADFYNDANSSLLRYERELERNEDNMDSTLELLQNTPKVLTLENALISQAAYALIMASRGEVDLSAIQGDKIISQELNPTYLKLMSQTTDLNMEKNRLENEIVMTERVVTELERELEDLEHYRQTLSTNHFAPEIFASMKNLVTIVDRPEVEPGKVTPRNTLNLAIGALLGLMLGLFVALFKNYWQNS